MTRFERQNYERRADDIEATMRLEWLTRHRVMSEALFHFYETFFDTVQKIGGLA